MTPTDSAVIACADVRDTALNERDYWRDRCWMLERQLEEAYQIVAAMAAERRRVA